MSLDSARRHKFQQPAGQQKNASLAPTTRHVIGQLQPLRSCLIRCPSLSLLSHGAMEARKDHICVAIRLRPLSDKERQRGDRQVWSKVGSNSVADGALKTKLPFDYVFDGGTGNQALFKAVGAPVVASCLDGVNGTVFAYGTTSSGKTHTMMGAQRDPGIVPLALAEAFQLAGRMPKRVFQLQLSMLEIYNEVLVDLLSPGKLELKLREDPQRGFFVEGARQEALGSLQQALALVEAGAAQRKVGATAFNDASSRSHTIIQLSIEAFDKPPGGRAGDEVSSLPTNRTLSFLHLIDLAGSECAKVEMDGGQRMEGSYINRSLLTLGTVINRLSEGGAAHIPFRDSSLTKLLQSSLVGLGARMAVVCTITPASAQAEETRNTLRFASRAKQVKVLAKRNDATDPRALIASYQKEVAALQRQLQAAKAAGVGYAECLSCWCCGLHWRSRARVGCA